MYVIDKKCCVKRNAKNIASMCRFSNFKTIYRKKSTLKSLNNIDCLKLRTHFYL